MAVRAISSVVRTSADRSTGDRLAYVQDELDAWLDRFEPDAIALERVYAADHVPTVMTTAASSPSPRSARSVCCGIDAATASA